MYELFPISTFKLVTCTETNFDILALSVKISNLPDLIRVAENATNTNISVAYTILSSYKNEVLHQNIIHSYHLAMALIQKAAISIVYKQNKTIRLRPQRFLTHRVG
jgi:hypothetical protein